MGELLTLRPLAVGSFNQSTIGAGESHEGAVQEVEQDGDTSYVYAPGGGTAKIDLFTIDGNGLPPNVTINSITVYVTAKASGIGTPSTVATTVKSGETTTNGGSNSLTGSYVEYSSTLPINPGTASAWTKYDIDGLEIGYVATPSVGMEARVTQAYVVVDYDPTTDALFFGA